MTTAATYLTEFVKETTTTTGTGDYALGGAYDAKSLPFSSWFADGDEISCIVTDGAGNFEVGRYTYNAGPNTLSRTVMWWSSDSGNPIDWAAGTKTIYCGYSSLPSALLNGFHNLDAAAAPTVNDDVQDGYTVGSLWMCTAAGMNGRIFRCLDNSAGAAVWYEIQTQDGLRIKEGANAAMGSAVMVAGTVTVSTTRVTANSRIFLTVQALGTVSTPKAIAVTARVNSTSFTITSADNTDTSTVAWQIVEPAT